MSLPGLFENTVPRADTRNESGGLAYRSSPKHALAQLAATGCLAQTYTGTDPDAKLVAIRQLAAEIQDPVYLAKLAIYSRQRALMKDMPAVLLLEVARRDAQLFRRIFPRIVDNGRVLRTLFKLIRAGVAGRRSLSYSLQKAFQRWLNEASVGTLLAASIGNNPSLRDVLRLARPTPPDNTRRALFGWLTGRPVERWAPATEADLPREVRDLIAFRAAETTEAEQVEILGRNRFRWDLLADSVRGPAVWKALARQMGTQALRMNLNTLLRHGVFDEEAMANHVAARLADPEEVRRGKQFPYQYFAAFQNAQEKVPDAVRAALEQAAELACGNVPTFPGPVLIGVDVSGSMGFPVTGYQASGHVSKMRSIDVAAVFGAAVLRRNPESVIVPFNNAALPFETNASEGILALSARLAALLDGGTDCSVPLTMANSQLAERSFAGVVLVSDNESWIGEGRYGTTRLLEEWGRFVSNQARLNPTGQCPRLICIDLKPIQSVQAPDRHDILNMGGFSDAVFEVIDVFLRDTGTGFVQEVEAIEL